MCLLSATLNPTPRHIAFLLSGIYVGRRSNSMRMRRHRRRRRVLVVAARATDEATAVAVLFVPPLACHYSRAKHAADWPPLGVAAHAIRP